MSKITCSVIEDMLPLYKEELLSEDSKILVEEHLKECTKCQEYLKDLSSPVATSGQPISYPEDNLKDSDKAPLLAIRKKLEYKKLLTISCSVVLAIIFMIIAYVHLTSPILLPYSEELISFERMDNNALLATLSSEVAGYEVTPLNLESGDADKTSYYHITLWTTLLNEYFPKSEGESFIVNKASDDGYTSVGGVYYQNSYTEEATGGDQLIYGSGLPYNGGIAVLPRLDLNYYFLFALGLTIIGLVVTLILRKDKKANAVALRITLFPASYLVGSLLVTGFSATSYFITKDFTSILLLMFPIYFLMLLGLKLLEYRKLKES